MLNLIKSIFRIIRTIILTTILICLILFMIGNRDEIVIHLSPLPFEVQTKVFLVMISFFLLGILFGILSYSQSFVSHFFSSLKANRKIKKLEKQTQNFSKK